MNPRNALFHAATAGVCAGALLLAGCGGGGSVNPSSGTNNTLVSASATPTAVISTSTIATSSNWLGRYPAGVQQLIGAPNCGVTVYKFTYATVGGMNEPTTATGALMVPSSAPTQCQGPRPIVLYAHGTALNKNRDLAALNDPSNPAFDTASRVAMIFTAQAGDIVVAPNYAGYDTSPLPYAPYLNKEQQSQDMIDALTAARQTLAQLNPGVSDNGKLFVTGYSQGGFVSMATLAKLDAQGRPATAGAPMSGPYGMLATGDEIFLGHPNVGGTAYLPLVANSYAHLPQGSPQIDPSQLFNPLYANAPNLFPGPIGFAQFSTLVQQGQIPLTAIFQSSPTGVAAIDNLNLPEGWPLYQLGFDPTNYLVSTNFRAQYLADVLAHPDGAAPVNGSAPNFSLAPPSPANTPQNALRQILLANDLRGYTPSMPLLMCGGDQDPEVFWNQNAGAMTATLMAKTASNPNLRFATLDLDNQGSPGTYANTLTMFGLNPAQQTALQTIAGYVQQGFQQYQQGVVQAAINAGYSQQQAALYAMENYHVDERPFCTVAARTFFSLYGQ